MKNLRILSLLMILTAATGCGQAPSKTPVAEGTIYPGITRSDTVFAHGMSETTPVVFQGALRVITFNRSSGYQIEIRDQAGTLLQVRPWAYSYGCAIVVGGTLHVFGTNAAATLYTQIAESHTDDLVNWSSDTIVLQALPGQTLYNTSIAPTDHGYVMAYEVNEDGIRGFSYRFATSTDLLTWTRVGGLFSQGYSACPTVRYIDGTYYILYLAEDGQGGWHTKAARSTDLSAFDVSPYTVLAPTANEGTNASDLDLVELNGAVYLYYLDGNQLTLGDVKAAVYTGTISDFLKGLWN